MYFWVLSSAAEIQSLHVPGVTVPTCLYCTYSVCFGENALQQLLKILTMLERCLGSPKSLHPWSQ